MGKHKGVKNVSSIFGGYEILCKRMLWLRHQKCRKQFYTSYTSLNAFRNFRNGGTLWSSSWSSSMLSFLQSTALSTCPDQCLGDQLQFY